MKAKKCYTHTLSAIGLFKNWLGILSLFTFILLGTHGCSSGSGSADLENDSELVISLTDAEGDFLSYTVDVKSIKMRKSNGAEIETLPLTTQLDFARYVEVTEFLTAATVPSGEYVGAQIVLDFSNANIVVQDENGDAINAIPQDINGNPVELLTVDMSFNGNRSFVIAPGIPAHITLDFDLDASNEIIINGSMATVVVKPVLIADTLLEKPKPHRLRGVLGAVDEITQTFNVLMRPFRHGLNNRFGKLKVQVSEATRYEINGETYASDMGLAQLAGLEPVVPVIVIGELSARSGVTERRKFNALEVYAGTSVPWGNKDIVSGNVISRSANTLVIRGATLIRVDGSFVFNDTVTVNLSDTTTVVKQADVENRYTINDLSVGQHVVISGNIIDSANLSLDAEHVRMLFTNVSGSVVTVSPLTVELQSINRRRIVMFDFSGTGTDAASDADAANYEVDSGNLTLDNLQIGDPLIARGHVRPFASAPEDFTAQTLFDATNMRAHLVTTFVESSVNAISDMSDAGLLLNLDAAANKHHLYRAGISTDLLSFVSMPVIVPGDSGNGLFVITQAESIRVYTDFSSYQSAVNGLLDGVTEVIAVHANGVYDVNLNQLVSSKINIRLADQ
jgi:uncharacterized protein DUF4382